MTVRRASVWVALLLVIVVVGLAVTGLGGPTSRELDPDNPEDAGMQALARVLEDQGVQVEVARGLDDALGADVDETTTVLVAGTEFLDQAAVDDLLAHVAPAGRLLLLDPSPTAAELFDLPVTISRSLPGTPVTAECADPTWREGERLVGASQLVVVDRDAPGADTAEVCFPPSPGYSAGGSLGGYVVGFPATADRPELTVLGIADALTNGSIIQEANAAAGLRLLGAGERLLWYQPQIADAAVQAPQSLSDVLPDVLAPATLLLAVATLVAMVWRGRRLGRVVVEPLPAVIRSAETTLSRSRLYRKAHDRDRALASLQLAARRRLASRLALSQQADTASVVRAVAAATGRPSEQVARILAEPSAPDDETLVRIAREVRSLEEGIHPR